MIPVWLQLTAALTAAAGAGVMGIALIPFLRKFRFCEPKQTEDGTAAGDHLQPTMGGLLLVFGYILGIAVSGMLYLQFAGADRTSVKFQSEGFTAVLVSVYAVLTAAAGWGYDYLNVRRRIRFRVHPLTQFAVVFTAALALCVFLSKQPGASTILDLGIIQADAGPAAVPVRAAVMALFWLMMQYTEHETDGVSISSGGILLLMTALADMTERFAMQAMAAFSAAGASIGCMIWNLHPAKCRLGRTGSSFLGGILPALCMVHGGFRFILLMAAVYAANLLPRLIGRDTVLAMAEQGKLAPWKRIALLAGFAGFCGILTAVTSQGV